MPRLSVGGRVYDSRPSSFPPAKAESWSVPTNVAQATMPASAQAPSPSSTTIARAAAAAVSNDAIDAATSLANSTRVRRGACGQSQRGTEMTSASETRRSSGSSTAPAGRATTAAPWPARPRSARAMSAYAERPRSARPTIVPAPLPTQLVRISQAARRRPPRRPGQHRSLDTPPAPVNRVTGPGAAGAVGVGAVVTATGHTVGLHGLVSLPPAGDLSHGVTRLRDLHSPRCVSGGNGDCTRGGSPVAPRRLRRRHDSAWQAPDNNRPGGYLPSRARLREGCVLVSATNGKTTSAAMAAAILGPRFRLAHNAAGANLYPAWRLRSSRPVTPSWGCSKWTRLRCPSSRQSSSRA